MGVPKTVVNDSVQFTGAVTEEVLLKRVLEAVGEEEAEADGGEQDSGLITPIG